MQYPMRLLKRFLGLLRVDARAEQKTLALLPAQHAFVCTYVANKDAFHYCLKS